MQTGRIRVAATLSILLMASICVWTHAQRAPKSAADYWPFREGNTWTMDTTVGEKKLTQIITVAKVTKTGGRTRAEVDYKTDGRSIQIEIYEVDASSIRRVAAGPNASAKLTPPLPVVQFPMTAGKKWSWKGEVATGGAPLKGTAQLTASGMETVKTGAGTFSAMRVHLELELAAGPQTIKVPNDYWFAPGIGLVRQKATVGQQTIEGVLTSYKLAK
jgi:hypothetical protein